MIPLDTIDVRAEDAGDQCEKKVAEKESNIMDTGTVIDSLIQIIMILYYICSITSSIETVLSSLDTLLGLHKLEGNMNKYEDVKACCLLANSGGWWGKVIEGICLVIGSIYSGWEKIYSGAFQNFCCFIQCSWCSGGGDCGIEGLGSFLQSTGIGQTYAKMGDLGIDLDPYNNIYFALACLCPTAIVVNLNKLRTIYKTQQCCIEKACQEGGSTADCDTMYNYALCMYWEGGVMIALVKLLFSVGSTAISGWLMQLLAKHTVWKCLVLAVYEVYSMPTVITNIQTTYNEMLKEFEAPDCEKLLATE